MKEVMKSICECIKNNKNNGITYEDFNIEKETFGTAIEECKKAEYIEGGFAIRNGSENKVWGCGIDNARLTRKGEEFIKE